MNTETKIRIYIEHWNNSTSLDKLAEAYLLTDKEAAEVIKEGRKLFNTNKGVI